MGVETTRPMQSLGTLTVPVGKKIAVCEDGLSCGVSSPGCLLAVVMDEVEWPQIVLISREVEGLVATCCHYFAYIICSTPPHSVYDFCSTVPA